MGILSLTLVLIASVFIQINAVSAKLVLELWINMIIQQASFLSIIKQVSLFVTLASIDTTWGKFRWQIVLSHFPFIRLFFASLTRMPLLKPAYFAKSTKNHWTAAFSISSAKSPHHYWPWFHFHLSLFHRLHPLALIDLDNPPNLRRIPEKKIFFWYEESVHHCWEYRRQRHELNKLYTWQDIFMQKQSRISKKMIVPL